MHFFVIQQHQILINQMIIVVNPIEIIVIIEITMIIIINHHLDIVRNHVNIVVNLKQKEFFFLFCFCFFFPFNNSTNLFCFSLLYDYILRFPVQNGKTPVFISSFLYLYVCITQREGGIIICLSVFDLFFSHFFFVFMYSYCTFSLFCDICKKKETQVECSCFII